MDTEAIRQSFHCSKSPARTTMSLFIIITSIIITCHKTTTTTIFNNCSGQPMGIYLSCKLLYPVLSSNLGTFSVYSWFREDPHFKVREKLLLTTTKINLHELGSAKAEHCDVPDLYCQTHAPASIISMQNTSNQVVRWQVPIKKTEVSLTSLLPSTD